MPAIHVSPQWAFRIIFHTILDMPECNALSTEPESFGGKPIDQNTCRNGIQDAKGNAHDPKYQSRHPNLHQKKTDKIGGRHYHLVCTALHFSPCIVRLQQVIDRQIMDGEKHTHTKNGNKEHRIMQRIFRPAGRKQ